jgi:hypothetical protein
MRKNKHTTTQVVAVPVSQKASPHSTLKTWAQQQSSEMIIPDGCTPIHRCGWCCQETDKPGQLCHRCSTLECIECGRTVNRADSRFGRCTSCRQQVASEEA